MRLRCVQKNSNTSATCIPLQLNRYRPLLVCYYLLMKAITPGRRCARCGHGAWRFLNAVLRTLTNSHLVGFGPGLKSPTIAKMSDFTVGKVRITSRINSIFLLPNTCCFNISKMATHSNCCIAEIHYLARKGRHDT